MKPYIENKHTPAAQKLFNYRQCHARMVVENAFGCLKGWWRCLLKQMDFELKNVSAVVATCVVLHNMCEMYGDSCRDEWVNDNFHITYFHMTITIFIIFKHQNLILSM